MILCKFTKIDSAVYIPHLDMLREMGRAVRRADLSVRFSEGFNPHMLLYFSQPLPLGLPSVCEYFCADSDEDPEVFRERLNVKLMRGMRITGSVKCEKAEVHAITTHASYRFKSPEKPFDEAVFNSIMSRKTIEIPVKTKKGIAVSDVKPRIYSLTVDGGDAVAVLGCGRENLRADSLCEFLRGECGIGGSVRILKEAAYVLKDGVLKTVDEIYGLT